MGIRIRWENERGDILDEIPGGLLGPALLLSSSLNETICLRFIDPYGGAIFNQRQIPVLISEFRALLQFITPEQVANLNEKWRIKYQRFNVPPRTVTAEEISEHISRIIELAERSKDAVHTYLKFLGD